MSSSRKNYWVLVFIACAVLLGLGGIAFIRGERPQRGDAVQSLPLPDGRVVVVSAVKGDAARQFVSLRENKEWKWHALIPVAYDVRLVERGVVVRTQKDESHQVIAFSLGGKKAGHKIYTDVTAVVEEGNLWGVSTSQGVTVLDLQTGEERWARNEPQGATKLVLHDNILEARLGPRVIQMDWLTGKSL